MLHRMKALLPLLLIIACSSAQAMSIAEYQALNQRAAQDQTAALLLQAYLSGAAEGILVSNAISPIRGICLPRDFQLLPKNIPMLIGPMLTTKSYKGVDLQRIPLPKMIVDALSVKHACKP